jgi:lipopolysaccharide export system permease protein
MIRRRYLSRMFLGRLLAALLGLAGLLQLLDLLDRASDVLQRGDLADLGRYALLRLPSIFGRAMPIAVLVAGLLTFRNLAMTLEMTALRAAGVSIWGVLRTLLPACLLATLFQAAMLNGIAPQTERRLAEWFAATDGKVVQKTVPAPPRRLWLRSGADIVGVDTISLDGRQLNGVLVVRRDAEGLTLFRTEAATATWGPGGWTLHQARIARPQQPRLQQAAEQPWPEGPPPSQFIDLARPTDAQQPQALIQSLQGQRATTRAPSYYLTRLHQAAVQLLEPFIMVLLAAPVVYAMPRRGAQAGRPLLCLALGLGYLLLAGLMGAMGEVNAITAVLAGWAAPAIFGTLGVVLLLQLEES